MRFNIAIVLGDKFASMNRFIMHASLALHIWTAGLALRILALMECKNVLIDGIHPGLM